VNMNIGVAGKWDFRRWRRESKNSKGKKA